MQYFWIQFILLPANMVRKYEGHKSIATNKLITKHILLAHQVRLQENTSFVITNDYWYSFKNQSCLRPIWSDIKRWITAASLSVIKNYIFNYILIKTNYNCFSNGVNCFHTSKKIFKFVSKRSSESESKFVNTKNKIRKTC